MEGEWLATLEQALAELQAKDANTQHKLDILISHIPQSENLIPSTQITPITPKAHGVTTLFLLLLLLWTFELYLILSNRYKNLLMSWSYLLILSWRSYLLIYDLILISWSYHLMMIQDTFLYTLLLTCIQHAFDSCLSLMIDMHSTCFYLTLDMLWTHILHVFTLRTTHGH